MKDEKRSEVIHDALNFLDDEMIEDVEKLRGFVEKEELEHGSSVENDAIEEKNSSNHIHNRENKIRHWHRLTALAASLCILISGSWIFENYVKPAENLGNQLESSKENISEENLESSDRLEPFSTELHNEEKKEISDLSLRTEGVEESASISGTPLYEIASGNGVEADMLGFFILNGRSYMQYEFQHDYKEEGADFVGKRVGQITDMIDEWTEEEGYVDGAGTYSGDIYEIKGVNPEFMLCMVWEDGSVETFINRNDITLHKGSDLVDDWLNLRSNFDKVSLLTSVDGQIAYTTLPLTEDEKEVFHRFLDAFAEGEFRYVEEKINTPFCSDVDTPDMMDFNFVTKNGLRVRFRTLGDGYVSFPWIDACIQIDQKVYDEVVDVLLQYSK